MRLIYLTAGHLTGKGQDNGAVTKYGNEGQEARKLVDAISKELLSKYQIAVYTENDSWTLVNTIAWLGSKIKPSDYTIDFHFNASTSEIATGVEVLTADDPNIKEKQAAEKLSIVISNTLGLRNRGPKTESDSQHSKLGILSNHKLSTANNLLVETCFISNNNDMIAYRNKFNELVINIAKTINDIIG